MGASLDNLLTRRLPQVLIAAVIAHYYLFIHAHAINIPNQDDILDLLTTIVALDKAQGFLDALAILFEEYNDHRTMASRVVTYAVFLAQGEINFRTLPFVSNLALPLILLLFYMQLRSHRWCWLYLLTAALLLMQIRAYTLPLWSQASFAYYWVYLYSFAALFLLHQVTPARFALAAACCTLASLTLASGQFAWLFGFASLAHQCLLLRNRPRAYLAAWALCSVALLLLWRLDFSFGTAESQVTPSMLLQVALERWSVAEVALRFVSFFFVALGAAVTYTSVAVAATTGFILLATLVITSLRSYREADVRLALCAWFVVASAAAITAGRAVLAEPAYVLNHRYSLLSVLLLCTVTTLVLPRLHWRSIVLPWLVIAAAASYAAFTFQRSPHPLQTEKLNPLISYFNRHEYVVWGIAEELTRGPVEEAIARGLYIPPCRPYPRCETTGAAAAGPK